MKIGLIDVDNCGKNYDCFPNLALMKISAYHKAKGDSVEWYQPLFSGHMDKVYVSKVFSFNPDYEYFIDADIVERSGSGFAISIVDGREVYDKAKDRPLPYEIEHIYPDYSIYGIKDTAYGFITRGCPRGCDFCHVKDMQGRIAHKVADLSEFWNGQKKIVLLDANISACAEWRDVFQQLIDSKAKVDFSQGLDIRLMTDEKIEMLSQIKVDWVHFAWDRYEDKEIVYPKLKHFAEITKWHRKKIVVYVLVGDRVKDVTNQDIERVMLLRPFCNPYVMIYDKGSIPRGHILHKFQRWVNNRFVWEQTPTFDEYLEGVKNGYKAIQRSDT